MVFFRALFLPARGVSNMNRFCILRHCALVDTLDHDSSGQYVSISQPFHYPAPAPYFFLGSFSCSLPADVLSHAATISKIPPFCSPLAKRHAKRLDQATDFLYLWVPTCSIVSDRLILSLYLTPKTPQGSSADHNTMHGKLLIPPVPITRTHPFLLHAILPLLRAHNPFLCRHHFSVYKSSIISSSLSKPIFHPPHPPLSQPLSPPPHHSIPPPQKKQKIQA